MLFRSVSGNVGVWYEVLGESAQLSTSNGGGSDRVTGRGSTVSSSLAKSAAIGVFPGDVVSPIHGEDSAGVRYWGSPRGESGVGEGIGIDNDDLDECLLWLRLGLGVGPRVGVMVFTCRTTCEAEVRMERNRWFSSSSIFIASFKASCSEALSLSSSSRFATFIRSSATILFA